MDKGVTIVVPVLDRAQNLAPLMDSINTNTENAYVSILLARMKLKQSYKDSSVCMTIWNIGVVLYQLQ